MVELMSTKIKEFIESHVEVKPSDSAVDEINNKDEF